MSYSEFQPPDNMPDRMHQSVQRCTACGGSLPATGRLDRIGECACALPSPAKLGLMADMDDDEIAFRLRIARLLAELHGDEYLSEQQCAKYMGINLVAWRKLERCFSLGTWLVEGEEAAEPQDDSETVLREACALARNAPKGATP